MLLGDSLCNGQPQSKALFLMRMGFLCTIKAVKKVFHLLQCQIRTEIGASEKNPVIAFRQTELDFRFGIGIFQSIVNEDSNQPFDF